MKEIPLTHNMIAIVDDEDYIYLSQFKWYAKRSTTVYYAARSVREGKKVRTIYMHREIMGCTKREEEVDHLDGNSINNRRSNFETVTRKENIRRRNIRHGFRSGVKVD